MSNEIVTTHQEPELVGLRSEISEIKKDIRDMERSHLEFNRMQEIKMQDLAFKDILMDKKQDAILNKLDSTEKSQQDMWSTIGEIKTLVSNQVADSIKAQGDFAKTLTKLTMTTLGYGIVGAGLLVFSIWSFQEWNIKLDYNVQYEVSQHKDTLNKIQEIKDEVNRLKYSHRDTHD